MFYLSLLKTVVVAVVAVAVVVDEPPAAAGLVADRAVPAEVLPQLQQQLVVEFDWVGLFLQQVFQLQDLYLLNVVLDFSFGSDNSCTYVQTFCV